MNRQREISEMEKSQEDKMINHPYNYDSHSFGMLSNHANNYGYKGRTESTKFFELLQRILRGRKIKNG